MELSATEKNRGGKGAGRKELQKNQPFSSFLGKGKEPLTIVIYVFFLRFYFYLCFTLKEYASLGFSCMQLEDIVVFSGTFNTALTS